jgi:hypothetical protein
MIMRRAVLIIVGICIIGTVQAQEESNWRLYKPNVEKEQSEAAKEIKTDEIKETVRLEAIPKNDKPAKQGEIRYIQDERISILDDYLKTHPIKHDGYRIQLVFGSREVVSSAKSRFVSSYSYSSYEDYLPPNFRLRVGDFLTRFQAEKVLREIKGRFPSAYIVRDKIEVPKEFR